MRVRFAGLAICTIVLTLLSATFAAAQQLEIHYINVGWGGSVLVKGPTGTTVLMEAGNTGKGTAYVVPYLQSIGLVPATGLDYTIAGHQHCDHIGGLDEVINAGYNVHLKNYYNGSTYSSTCATEWSAAAGTTTGGALAVPTVGQQIALGNGAKLTFVAVNGHIIGGGTVAVSDENDRSIAVLIQYGGFDYLWASDLGGGTIDEACTGRFTSSQVDVETSVITAISPGGAFPLISAGGIDLLHVNHHGSESSTNHNYMNMAQPALAIIGVGDGESTGWDLPRIDVVEHVLAAQATACVTAPPAFVLQTEEGNPAGSLTSFYGFNVGNIKVTTDGLNNFTVNADGNIHQGLNELASAGLPRTFVLDDVSTPDTTAPTTSVTAPATGATLSGTTTVTASASDDRAVARVEFYLDNVLQFTDTTAAYAWSWNTTTATNGPHMLLTKAYDAAGNVGSSSIVDITVNNVADTTPPSVPGSLTATGAKRKISLTWSASTDNVGVTGYQVWRSSSPTGTFTQIATTTATTYTNTQLTSGSTWYYQIKATDAAGNVSAASNTASAAAK